MAARTFATRGTVRHSSKRVNGPLVPLVLIGLSLLLSATGASAAMPALPAGAQAIWVVAQPEEIVTYLAFDPARVERRLPPALRFITVGELAAGDVQWAKEFLQDHPAQAAWGVSFLEIVRMRTFTIDGRGPSWPAHGAAALWFARVAPSDSTADLGPGRPFLALDLWIPDRAYVAYMLAKGYHATYGDVRLRRSSTGTWAGSVKDDGLRVTAACTPEGPVTGGPGSAGMQAIFPPASSSVTGVVRIAFAGHREQSCGRASSWILRGAHPLVGSVVLGPTSFEFGYDLRGGAYPR